MFPEYILMLCMSLHIPGSVCVGVTLWFGCGGLQAEALLACSCGMWGLGVNDHLEQRFGFSWALLRNEFAFLVLFVRQE